MAIVAFDNAAFLSSGVSAAALTITITAASNAVLLVAAHVNEAATLSSVVAGGVGCTRLAYVAGGTGNTQIWGLTAPAAGTLAISARFAGANQAIWCLAAATYTGCRTSATPFGTAVVASAGPGLLATITVDSTASDMAVVAWGMSGVPVVTLGLSQTERGSATHSTSGKLVWGDRVGETSLTLSATAAGTATWAIVAVNLIHSDSAVVVQSWKYTLGMMGVGR